jgi:hypothetical protein
MDHVAWLTAAADLARIERRMRQLSHQIGMPRSEPFTRRQFELGAITFCEPQQAGLQWPGELSIADCHRRRPRGERADHFALIAVDNDRDTIVQSDVRAGRNARRLLHGRRF